MINVKKKTKVIAISTITAVLLFVYYNYDYKYTPKYDIVYDNKEDVFTALYSYGKVYIVNDLNKINNLLENDIVILDERDSDNPNMKIISSHYISDKDIRNDIITIMLEYEKKYPSNWSRTIESMRLEWFVHNLFYDLNYKRNHTNNVDLDNNDEEKYNNKTLQRILKI